MDTPETPPPDRVLRVTRTGGVAGARRTGEVDLSAADPRAEEASALLDRCALADQPASAPRPDRFRFRFVTAQVQVTLGEQDLSDDLARLAALVLDDQV